MKTSIVYGMALAMGLAFTPIAEAVASVEGVNIVAPAKKRPVKKTAKKATKRKAVLSKTTASTTETATTVAPVKVDPSKRSKTSTPSESSGSGLLGGIMSAIGGGAESGSILSGLSTIFDAAKGATKDRIIGTWTYVEPAVVFTSKNVLNNIGGKVASQAIEKQLQAQFDKAGIRKGMMKMTFDKDGKFMQSIGAKATSGTYTIQNHSVVLNYEGDIKQIVGTTQLDGSDLLIVMDASKLLKYANALGSFTGNAALKSLGSIIGSVDGMQVGLKLNK